MRRSLSFLFLTLGLGLSTSTFAQLQNGEVQAVQEQVQQPVVIQADQTLSCNGKAIQLSATHLLPNEKFQWSPTEGLSDPSSPNPTVVPAQTTTYYLSYVRNGRSMTSSITLKREDVQASFVADPLRGAAPLTVQFTNTSNNAFEFNWDFGMQESVEESPSISFREAGEYPVQLIVAGELGCRDTAIGEPITTFEEAKFFIPTTFTPNYDGLNETFEIVSQNVAEFVCIIYNNHGEKVIELRNSDEYWDGEYNGYPAPSSSYTYHIFYTDLAGNQKKLKGSVDLQR
ncbi:gliding motility-associated C-terminal domain-containing protein [bacterium SCSIO 12741]|nr:gliding motility-associated C-terminal domain-containing protein [bacterium SCSIO 12741]